MKSTRCPGMSDMPALKPSKQVWINQMPNSLFHSQEHSLAQNIHCQCLTSPLGYGLRWLLAIRMGDNCRHVSLLWCNMNLTGPRPPWCSSLDWLSSAQDCVCSPQNPSQPVLVLHYPTHTQNSNNPKGFTGISGTRRRAGELERERWK